MPLWERFVNVVIPEETCSQGSLGSTLGAKCLEARRGESEYMQPLAGIWVCLPGRIQLMKRPLVEQEETKARGCFSLFCASLVICSMALAAES